MKRMAQLSSITLSAALCASLLAACGSEDKPAATAAPASPAASAAAANADSRQASKTPVTVNFFYHDEKVEISGDLPIFKKAAEITNVSLKNVAPKGGESKQAWNLMLASGEVADILAYNLSDLNSIALQKALTPLDDLIDKHAPNIKKFLNEHPTISKGIAAADGKIYVIPFIADGTAQEGWFIRKDWLDKLNLQEPKTVDEYYKVLKAFKEQDPNGNGKQDEVPFFARNSGIGSYALLPLWNAYRTFYLKNGKITFGPAEPEYKTGMANIAQWYKEGLIDKEIFTRGNQARDTLFANNTGGSVHDWFASTSNYNVSMASKVPGFSLLPVAPPASSSGKVVEVTSRSPLNNRGWSISAKAKDPAMIMKYFDFWFSEEGRRMHNFGIEGDTYTMEGGQPKFTEKVLKESAVVDYLIKNTGAQIFIGGWQDFNYEVQWSNKIAVAGMKLYQDNKYISADYTLPPLNFTVEEGNKLKDLLPTIETYVAETSQKWYMGGEDVNAAFDKYLARLNQLKLSEVVKIYQDAYDRFMKQ